MEIDHSLFYFNEVENAGARDCGRPKCGFLKELGMTVIALTRWKNLSKPKIMTMARSERTG